jgi:hypothetical protein
MTLLLEGRDLTIEECYGTLWRPVFPADVAEQVHQRLNLLAERTRQRENLSRVFQEFSARFVAESTKSEGTDWLEIADLPNRSDWSKKVFLMPALNMVTQSTPLVVMTVAFVQGRTSIFGWCRFPNCCSFRGSESRVSLGSTWERSKNSSSPAWMKLALVLSNPFTDHDPAIRPSWLLSMPAEANTIGW